MVVHFPTLLQTFASGLKRQRSIRRHLKPWFTLKRPDSYDSRLIVVASERWSGG